MPDEYETEFDDWLPAEESVDVSEALSLRDKRVAFLGKLGGLSRKDAMHLLRQQGAIASDPEHDALDLLVIGAEEGPLSEAELLKPALRERAAQGTLEIIHETDLWQRLGLVEPEQAVKRLYTPAMLAELLGVSVRVIRRWHRRGLIVPARTVHRLPYFDFQEIATAKRLAQLVAAGASPETIERKLASLSDVLPNVERPLAQLGILVEGRQLLLRQGEGLVEPGGQLRIDFDALEPTDGPSDRATQPATISWRPNGPRTGAVASVLDGGATELHDPLLEQAYEAEDEGDLTGAVDCYRAVLARDGPRPDVCFQLGELLYRLGDVSAARERYFMAIELDGQYVEARASLGVVLAENGRLDLAIAAFRGALSLHNDYPDGHYNLARALDDDGQPAAAAPHWRRFLELAPNSPWADEARHRLGIDERDRPTDDPDDLDMPLDQVTASDEPTAHGGSPNGREHPR
jgi:tetratricopeptide (TPR) repeat protein